MAIKVFGKRCEAGVRKISQWLRLVKGCRNGIVVSICIHYLKKPDSSRENGPRFHTCQSRTGTEVLGLEGGETLCRDYSLENRQTLASNQV